MSVQGREKRPSKDREKSEERSQGQVEMGS